MKRLSTSLVAFILFAIPALAQTSSAGSSNSSQWQVVSQTPAPNLAILTPDDVVRMVRKGQSTISIIEKIQNRGISFDAGSDGFSVDGLKQKGVPEIIVNEMIEVQMGFDSADLTITKGVLSNRDVRDMLAAGLPSDLVVAKIKNTSSKFDTTPSALAALKIERVPESVVLAMVEAAPVPDQPDAASTVTPNPPPTPSDVTDRELLGTVPACAQFLEQSSSLSAAGIKFAQSLGSADRDSFLSMTNGSLTPLMDSGNACKGAPEATGSPRVSSAVAAEEDGVLGLYFAALLNKQEADYQVLVNKYNQLVVQYNANLAYVRSWTYRLSVAQYFSNIFERPVPQSLTCTSQSFGSGSIMNCD